EHHQLRWFHRHPLEVGHRHPPYKVFDTHLQYSCLFTNSEQKSFATACKPPHSKMFRPHNHNLDAHPFTTKARNLGKHRDVESGDNRICDLDEDADSRHLL
ncbi:MAG: hypothetical protein Q7T82_08510, partial [Armatimonadota bacterium]|nr:hypothetical protein [Armatimonadota bacterium]